MTETSQRGSRGEIGENGYCSRTKTTTTYFFPSQHINTEPLLFTLSDCSVILSLYKKLPAMSTMQSKTLALQQFELNMLAERELV